jgi:hypothetical protein
MVGFSGADPSHLFYDRGCGPCSWVARTTSAVSRSPIEIASLDGPLANHELGWMDPTRRFGSFHLRQGSRVYSGAEALPSLVGLVAGSTAERAVRHVPPLRHAIERVYLAFWEYRRTRGCAAPETG